MTVGTLFHKTHVELPKWFQAIKLIMNESKKVSIRQLAVKIDVTKNTSSYMIFRIQDAIGKEPDLLWQILARVKDMNL